MNNSTLTYSYDGINRLYCNRHTVRSGYPDIKLKTTNAYLMIGNNRTALISQILFNQIDSSSGSEVVTATHGKLNYTYDANGNIKTIKENNALKATYTYDGLNQLVREDNVWLNKSITYEYDGGGNILSKKEYAYTTGALGTATDTIPYSYGDSNWKDKLTAYDGKAITYDAIGNPLTYDGYTYSWQKGRQLASISGNGKSLTFKYNSYGMRTKKISGNTTTEYIYSGNLLMSQSDGINTLNYIYSPYGEAIGVSRNGYHYYYLRNVQGDIIALYNCYGDINSRYVYDSWGKLVSVTNANGAEITDPNHIANLNPLRYRGYYYDTETGLFYVGSRYYDPEIGRWLSPEPNVDFGEFDEGAGLLAYNVYTYCANNPIMYVDHTGEAISLIACVVIGAVAGLVLGGTAGAVISYKKFGKVKAKYVFIGAAAGAAIGAAAGYAIGIAIGASVTTATTAKGFASVFKISSKISGQMAKRGWTNKLIKDTILKNVGRKAFNKATGNAATAYFTSSGAYVVIDNITKQIVQISNRFDPNWVVDATIKLLKGDVFIK